MKNKIAKIAHHTKALKEIAKGTPMVAIANAILGQVALAEQWLAFYEAQQFAVENKKRRTK